MSVSIAKKHFNYYLSHDEFIYFLPTCCGFFAFEPFLPAYLFRSNCIVPLPSRTIFVAVPALRVRIDAWLLSGINLCVGTSIRVNAFFDKNALRQAHTAYVRVSTHRKSCRLEHEKRSHNIVLFRLMCGIRCIGLRHNTPRTKSPKKSIQT